MTQRYLPDWLAAYRVYTANSLSPDSFHTWVGLSLIASALQRKVYIPVNYFMCFPNDYIVLIGPPGTMKSTAIRIGRGLLNKVPSVRTTTESITREKLILNLSQSFKDGHSSLTIHSPELASFVTSSKMDMIVFLIDLFDSPPDWTHDTKMGGQNKIVAPCINLLAATTVESLQASVPVETSGIGLTSRILFIHETSPRIGSWRQKKSADTVKLEALLIADLMSISMLSGEMILDDDADAFYDQWFKSQIQKPNTTGDASLDQYFVRKHTHVLKIAMCVAAARRSGLRIMKGDIETVLEFLEQVESKMGRVFSGFGRNTLAAPTDKLIDILAQAYEEDPSSPDVSYDTITMKLRRDVRREEIDEMLETLSVTKAIVKTTGHGSMPLYRLRLD